MILFYDTLQLGPTLFLLVRILASRQAWTGIPLAPKASNILPDACLPNVEEPGEYKRFEENTGILRTHQNRGKSMCMEQLPATHHSRFRRTRGGMNYIGKCKEPQHKDVEV